MVIRQGLSGPAILTVPLPMPILHLVNPGRYPGDTPLYIAQIFTNLVHERLKTIVTNPPSAGKLVYYELIAAIDPEMPYKGETAFNYS